MARTAGSVSSAVSGCGAVRPTRTRPPTAVTDTTCTSRWLRAEPGSTLPGGASAMSHGYTVTATGPAAGSEEVTSPPPSSATRVSPSAPGAAVPVSTTAPVKSATNGDAGRRRELAGGADLHDAAPVHHAHAVAEQRGLLEVVRDQQRGHRGLVQDARQLATGGGAGAGIERGQGLVEEQRLRADGESARDGHPLALAARQRARPGVRPGGEPEAARAAPARGPGARGAARP